MAAGLSTQELSTAQPVVIVPYELFQRLLDQVAALEKDIQAIRTENTPQWLTRSQAMDYLQCGPTKLWALHKANEIEHSTVGSKPRYSLRSCERYLQDRSTSKDEIHRRLNLLISSKKNS
ncbi:hypothetical protein GCM10027347_44270 [Larkinella harenae]